MTERIGVDEAQERLDELLDRVATGEEFVIARDGRPVARLVLPRGSSEPPSA
ncbi:type II toxin-antitoxin system Phd/YefM family antitoxin [Actinomycetospora succinea]|uniref:type II toxin-antitoxin system Phd/YefM family antitoxin n=1 Tax=Actinomycetospora succinea TaxID=663603 RepID=UPI001AAD3027|nr:type II toxin-antitoxin system prevent-host-death family antitoxin [Actinomycetospora succinea]